MSIKAFLVLILLSGFCYAQKTVTPTWVRSAIRDTAITERNARATADNLLLAKSAFADSFLANINRTSIAQIKEVSDYEPVIADSSILLYSGGVWSVFDLGQALVALDANAIVITYPDANTINFNDVDAILLDPATLEIDGSNKLSGVHNFFTGIDSIHYGQDSIVVPHGVGSTPSYVDIQLMSDSFGYRTWVNVIGATTFSVKRNTLTVLDTPTSYIKFKWMAKK